MDIKNILELANTTAKEVTRSPEEWCDFLKTASRFYKAYRFDEQLLIYAQKPDATACAQMSLWNRKFQRWVDLKAKPITLLHFNQFSKPSVSEVYDVANTHSLKKEAFHLWQIHAKDHEPVIKALHKIYPEQTANQMEDYLMNMTSELVKDTYLDFFKDIPKAKENTFLEELDGYNTEVIFKTTMLASAQYAILYRCGLDPESYIDSTDLQGIINFNSIQSLAVLGEAVAQTNQTVLSKMSQIVNNIRKEEKQHDGRKNDRERDSGDIRTRKSKVPAPISQRNLRGDASGGQALEASSKSRPKSTGDDGKTPPARDPLSESGGSSKSIPQVAGRRKLTTLNQQPIVTIEWSENPQLKSGQIFTLYEANDLFRKLDQDRYNHGDGYDKTKFSIQYTIRGAETVYEGRQDLGEKGGGSLIDHISNLCEHYSDNQAWKDMIINRQGIEAWTEKEKTMHYIKNQFVPYLKCHITLSEMEQKADDALNALFEGDVRLNKLLSTDLTYYTKLKTYVAKNRHKINMDSQINFSAELIKQEQEATRIQTTIKKTEKISNVIKNLTEQNAPNNAPNITME